MTVVFLALGVYKLVDIAKALGRKFVVPVSRLSKHLLTAGFGLLGAVILAQTWRETVELGLATAGLASIIHELHSWIQDHNDAAKAIVLRAAVDAAGAKR